jgi:hypothetical protein
MTRRKWIALMTILLVLFVQFGIPSMQFFSEGSNRWGWQMYSRQSGKPEITAVMEDGAREAVRLRDHLIVNRSEIRVDEHVVDELCERLPDAQAIELVFESTSTVTVHQCDN